MSPAIDATAAEPNDGSVAPAGERNLITYRERLDRALAVLRGDPRPASETRRIDANCPGAGRADDRKLAGGEIGEPDLVPVIGGGRREVYVAEFDRAPANPPSCNKELPGTVASAVPYQSAGAVPVDGGLRPPYDASRPAIAWKHCGAPAIRVSRALVDERQPHRCAQNGTHEAKLTTTCILAVACFGDWRHRHGWIMWPARKSVQRMRSPESLPNPDSSGSTCVAPFGHGRFVEISRRRLLVSCAAGASVLFAARALAATWHNIDVAGDVPPLAFTMTDATTGKSVTAADFRGKLVMLYFGYTMCPDVCPLTLQNVGAVLKKLGPAADDVRVLFVTVDPNRDTLPVLKQYTALFAPQVVGLRGSADELAQLARRYRLAYSVSPASPSHPYGVTHSSAIYVFDRDGGPVLLVPSLATTTPDLAGTADDLQRLLNRSQPGWIARLSRMF